MSISFEHNFDFIRYCVNSILWIVDVETLLKKE